MRTQLLAIVVRLFASASIVLCFVASTPVAHAAGDLYDYTKIHGAFSGVSNGNSVEADAAGNSYSSGLWFSNITFDGVGGSDSRTSPNGSAFFLTKRSSQGDYLWTRVASLAASSYTIQTGLATASNGDSYIVGWWKGTVTFDGVGGSDVKTTSEVNSFITKFDSNGVYQWTRVTSTPDDSDTSAAAVAVDQAGNAYMSGRLSGTGTLDGPGGSDTITTTSAGKHYVIKYNSNGSYAWSRMPDPDSVASSGGSGIAVDKNGNIYTTGYWFGTLTFDGVGGSSTFTTSNNNGFTSKYNSSGTHQWTRVTDVEATDSYASILGVATDNAGDVVIGGSWSGSVIFDGAGGSDTRTSDASTPFVTKYSAAGNRLWTNIYPNADPDGGVVTGLAVDSTNNVYASGWWLGSITFDGTGGSDTRTIGNSNHNGFLTKVSPTGSYIWTKSPDTGSGSASVKALDVKVTQENQIYLTGFIQNVVVFDGLGGSDSQNGGISGDAFLTSFNKPPTVSPIVQLVGAPKTGYGEVRDYTLPAQVAVCSIIFLSIGIGVLNRKFKV